MAEIEIYKIKKTVDPKIRKCGMYEFFGMVDGPLPQNYVRAWAGELPSGDLAMLWGKTAVDPPDGYHGGPLEKSDIVVVDGRAHFLDETPGGHEFVAISFDTTGIRNDIHVDYGWHISTEEAAIIPREFASICKSIHVPIGYHDDPDRHGSHKDETPFLDFTINIRNLCYIHPQFVKGEEARAFAGLLMDLSKVDQWEKIAAYLRDNYPINMADLKAACKSFAPEFLLPDELRPLAGVIPPDAGKPEIGALAAKVKDMDEGQRNLLYAAAESRLHGGDVNAVIELAENLDCFTLEPALDAATYGARRLEQDWIEYEPATHYLEKSESYFDKSLAKYISLLEQSADEAVYGRLAAQEANGVFTTYGLLTQIRDFQEIDRSTQNIPTDERAAMPDTAGIQKKSGKVVFRDSGEKESVVEKIRAARETAKAAPPQIKKERDNQEKSRDR